MLFGVLFRTLLQALFLVVGVFALSYAWVFLVARALTTVSVSSGRE